MSVAYALLRKPFTDELLILEQLLANGEDFIDRFFHKGNQNLYDPFRERNKLKILEGAIGKLSIGYPFNSEVIYKLRYDKSCKAGVNGISNQAIHIVTSDPNYRTADQNFNFIFSGSNEYEDYCSQYYFFVPILLSYTAAVVDEILFNFLQTEEHQVEKALRAFKRLIVAEFIFGESAVEEANQSNTLQNLLILTCDKCSHKNSLDRADFELLLNLDVLLCKKCFTPNTFNSKRDIQGIIELMQLMK